MNLSILLVFSFGQDFDTHKKMTRGAVTITTHPSLCLTKQSQLISTGCLLSMVS